MKPDFLVISYYTANTGYATEVKNLLASLATFNLAHVVSEVPSLGSWQANTHFKAEFIRTMALQYCDRRLLFVDADAVIRQEPVLLDQIDADFAVHYREHKSPAGTVCSHELLSGTIYLVPNLTTFALLDRWITLNAEYPDLWDQVNLYDAVRECSSDLRLFNLPPEYTFIFDLMRRDYPDAEPVIEHFQASRRFKDRI